MSRTQHFLDCGCKSCVKQLLKDIEDLEQLVKDMYNNRYALYHKDALEGHDKSWPEINGIREYKHMPALLKKIERVIGRRLT